MIFTGRIEIIVGCYNQEKYLPDAEYSARNQIVPYPFEKMYTLPEYSVRVVHDNCGGKGSGCARARNKAIEESKADWIVWLDADDIIPSHFLHEIIREYENYSYPHHNMYSVPTQFIEGTRYDRICCVQLGGKVYPFAMGCMFSKKMWESVSGFDELFFNMSDLDFWIRSGAAGYKVASVTKTFLMRRNVPESLLARGASREEEILAMFNAKHGTRLTSKLLPYKVPLRDESIWPSS